MKIILLVSMVASCLAVLPLEAGAQGCMGRGHGMGPGIGMMGQRGGRLLLDPAGLPALKDKLGLASGQEVAWNAYAEAVTALWNFHDTMQRSAAADPRMMRGQHWSEAQAVHARVWEARDALSKALTQEQRQALDQSVPVPCNGAWVK